MSGLLERYRAIRATIPMIWVAYALSLFLHAVVLFAFVPHETLLPSESPERGTEQGPLVVQLAPPPSPAARDAAVPSPPPSLRADSSPARRAPPPRATPRPAPTPPVIAQAAPAPVAVPKPAPPAAAPAPPTPDLDFSAYLDERRRARGAPAPAPAAPQDAVPSAEPVESERERHNRIVAANLGLSRTPTYGPDPTGGGVFQILRLGTDHAEFMFFGWNKDIRRNSRQRIEVSRGENPDIRIATVRRMITIIRDNESGDFTWVSRVQGRDVKLSARPQHNAELEAFLMTEFFAGQFVR